MGDFHCVREPNERKNSKLNPQQAEDFNQFIRTVCLLEYALFGYSFTHRSDDGQRFSKIDRALVCYSFLSNWPTAKLTGLPRYRSDYQPLLLVCSDEYFAAPPFLFFNSWLKEEELAGIVKNMYAGVRGFNPPDKLMGRRLKAIKLVIKPWCRNINRRNCEIVADLSKKVEELDLKAESAALSENLKQWAKAKWVTEGDENSALFHGFIKGHQKHNRINGLNFNGVWISQPDMLKEEIKQYFEGLFKETNKNRPLFSNNAFKVLFAEQSSIWVKCFSKEEIKEAVWECGGDKALGPDGFTFSFIKHLWDTLEPDFVTVLDYFYVHGTLNRGCNSSFIILAPKSNNPPHISEFRPISLIGCISKILANRLKQVISHLKTDTQTTYVEGRSILEGSLIVNELVSWAKKSKGKMLLFKVDFEKAFDSLSWEFLDSILSQMGFPALWRSGSWVYYHRQDHPFL
ncbi:uncharacterized protein LOC110913550 [Helianthus annuus]|uniref:uncharacterized protein LOC110913550 n=1 Tax=Helianthus annuus TaxID=4232 RepID=UPI000B90797C|nr:uncharacterized protein LOC110913550 [Helianthus annuus]